MKTLTFKIIIIGLLLLGTFNAKAEFIKKIHRGWAINKVEALKIENKFGHINFVDNRDDSVTIDVSIEIEKLSEKQASYLADQINFHFSLSEGTVNAKTEFGDNFKTNNDFSIVYTINIPIDRDLDVENKYGNVTLGDLRAKGDFEIKYGSIQGQDMQAPENEKIKLEIKYGSASFNAINNLFAEIEYSKFSAIKIEKAIFDTKYSVIRVDQLKSVFSDSQYDSYEFETVDDLRVDSKFTGWNIHNLMKSLKIDTQYGDVDIDHVSPDFTQIDLENSYGNIHIGIPEKASYNLESDSYYCKVKHHDADYIKHIEDNNHTYIKAVIGDTNTETLVKIETKYGKVNLFE